MSRDALIVGINSYQHFNPPLKAPEKDAEAIAQRLEQDGDFRVWRVPEQIDQANRPAVSLTQKVSQVTLKQALKRLFLPDSKQAPETALFYFSGHGIPDEEGEDGYDKGYLAASDTNPNNPSSGISLGWLHWLLSKSPVKQQIIWLDCCHSGSLIVNVGAANPGNSESRDRCFIASSRDFETSWEDLNSPYSVLTKALLEGLEPSRLPGRWIDTFALVDYVNQALKGELQTPVCTNFGEAINLTRSWQAVNEVATDGAVDSGFCPYKGLEFFDCNGEDPKYFFGREKLIGQLLDQVRTSNFMALVGASGNGKSSVLRAGLIHQLRLGRRIAGSDQWEILITRPDGHPMQNLASVFVPEDGSQLDRAGELGKAIGLLKEGAAGLQRLVEVSTAPRIILVIDQFEEVFTRCESAEEREQFFSCLMGALEQTRGKLCLIIAMRADFVGKCLEQDYGGLAQRVQQHMMSVLPLTTDELRDAICKPAEQANLTVEPALVTEILTDIKGAPGSLPLLQYTLKELWQQRQESTVMLSTYQELGGINGTLDKRATEIYNTCDADQQSTVQHIFQQLTQLGEGTEDTRRRVFLDNLISEPLHPAKRVRTVIDTLSSKDNRLLVTSEVIGKGEKQERRAIVDVAHEALIRHWRLLRQWIEKNRDLLRQQRRIEIAAGEWRTRKNDTDYFLQGRQLSEALRFQKENSHIFPLSQLGKSFVYKSWQHQKNRRLKFLGTAVLVPLGIAIYAGLQIRTNVYLEPSWNLVNDYNARSNKISRNPLVRALEEINKANHSLDGINLVTANLSGAKLSGAKLSGADLRNADLSNADLISVYLISTNLSGANLSGANLKSARLRNADISSTNLSDVDFYKANLSDANLSGANLSVADFRSTNLSVADFRSTNNLRNAKFRWANLSYADFSSADLSYTNLSYTNLSSVNFNRANLSDANLRNAKLRYANLRYANLSDVDFYGADFYATDLRSADLRSADLHSAKLNYANLSDANFNGANLSDANLRNADFNSTIFLSTDLRTTKGLTKRQLEGENPPYICNSPLSDNLGIESGKDRDCGKLANILHQRYPDRHKSLEAAEEFVKKQRQKTWE
ncbi:pentapeptide repeat-containing protein [Leptolyngbya cf. ectocarpi LEGE 11479]|uniref:Pentapeptide repeat-containing protein n=1 Tax=Leptolyngbya cf. ectocarpi LEGE 11479 TaxID=1828722 RepID=A0A929FBG8_LEPEC|nr:pentapeptide repeat-containing protein [Leptolyngbya ectocarpi]MBE9068979.1 pentapeptide repeat-containing protein [Leptolyngbya cf. ectocarpi LEGE 11479]